MKGKIYICELYHPKKHEFECLDDYIETLKKDDCLEIDGFKHLLKIIKILGVGESFGIINLNQEEW